MAEEDRLKIFWEHFFKAETGTYEKSTWLDLFLAEFLIRLEDGANPKELIHFCSVSGVVSLVGCELLCGIHRVTSSQRVHSRPLPTASDNEQPEPMDPHPPADRPASLFTWANSQPASDILRQYLLTGLPWRCLMMLRALGVEGLSCCRQLSSVLIWLFGELTASGGARGRNARPHLPVARTPIHMLFSHRIWSTRNLGGTPTQSSVIERSSVTGRSRQASTEPKSKRKIPPSDHSSDSNDSNGDLQLLNRSLTIKVCTPDDDFQYFDSPKTSSDYPDTLYTDPFHSPKKPKPKASDYMDDKHREMISTEISAFEFTSLIIELLQELCKTESSLSGSEGSQISVQCINFSLRNLCSLQFGSLQSMQFNSEEVSTMKVVLTELLIVSLDKVLVHSDLCAKLINNGILPMLLRILEDVICKNSSKYNERKEQKNEEKLSKVEAENLLRFVFGISYSITAFFHCLLMQCRTVDKLREFTDQFKLYGECLKGGLLKDCIELMVRIPDTDQAEIVILMKKLIDSLGKLISGMKTVRSEVVHTAACPRVKHKVCRQRVTAGMHHHHDILGEAGTGLPLSSACCISVLYGTLTSLVCDEEVSAITPIRNKILRVMLNGVCCCFSPGFLMESIVRLMLTHNSTATLCLQVLEHTVYGELGASVLIPKLTDQLPCSVCEPSDDKRDYVRKYCPHGVSPVERKSVWSFLIHYNSLLQLDNHNNVLHATVSHLLRITPKCRTEMKYELLFSVIYPTFIVAKHRYIIRMEESAYFLTVSCLNIFASLLNSVSFAEQFIQKGGLSYVLELVSLTEFSNQCCSILEIAIVVEIFKLIKETADITFYREISSLSSVQMLIKSLSEMTDKCYKIYKIRLPETIFKELSDISKERDSLAFIQAQTERIRKSSTPKIIIKSAPFFRENVLEETVEDFIEVLKTVWTFWKTCSNVCLYSPMFRQFIVTEPVFLDSYALLKILLYHLCHCETGSAEMRTDIKFLEALLTVQFSVADVTSGRSKETSSAVIRTSLTADGGALSKDGGNGLRALCEALIRVCVAQPSDTHVMPRAAAAKVPPLECTSNGSSVECSSSEESTRAYSEQSEPLAAPREDGYEADVEIGKLEALAAMKTKKMSASLPTVHTPTSGYQYPGEEIECAEYVKNGELAHPELCTIVVDILAQLINKVLLSTADSLDAGRAAASLARACCGRLSSALSGSRIPPPALLERLLEPAAKLLVKDEPSLAELQSSIQELIIVVGSRRLEPGSLYSLLRSLATGTPAPLPGRVLSVLKRLADDEQPLTPDHILTFPVDTALAEDYPSPEELNYVVINTSQSLQADARAKVLQEAHIRNGITSPWSRSAVRCGIEGAGWAPWMQGFALILWLRTAPVQAQTNGNGHAHDSDEWSGEAEEGPEPKRPLKPRPSALLHVYSIGHDSLMFELWIDVNTGELTVKLSRPELHCNKVVAQAVAAGSGPTAWRCVALSLRDCVIKRQHRVQVTVYVNGCETDTMQLPIQGILVRKVMPTNVLVGDCSAPSSGGGAYHLSSAVLLRAPLLAPPSVLLVPTRGPDHHIQIRCETPNFSPLLTPSLLESGIDWDQVFEQSATTVRELQDNLLLTFDAHSPQIFNLYHQTGVMPTVPALVFGARPPAVCSGPSVPESVAATWRAPPVVHSRRALSTAVYMLGGVDVLMFLFARVVELDGAAEEQALALSILLRVCQVDNRLYSMMYGGHTLEMLHTVFAAPKCKVSCHLVKAILDAACSSSVLRVWGSGVTVVQCRRVVVGEPRLLVCLLAMWRQLHTVTVSWEVETSANNRQSYSGSLWTLALCCISALLHDADHATNAFNHYQVSRVGLMKHLLTACKERFLNSECGPLEEGASEVLVDVVRALVGVPPALDRLSLLADFLLLMHQASDTFVTHSRANFYFLLTSETQQTSEYRRDSFTQRRPTKRRKKKDPDVASSSSVTSEDINENLLRELSLEDKLDQTQLASSVESSKHMKGIINMQIKEGRKKDRDVASSSSATSEDINENIELSLEDKLDQTQLASSVESSKHKKGFINMQIKEERRHNVSSTSENSDILNDKPDPTKTEAVNEMETMQSTLEGEGEEIADTEDNTQNNDVMYSSVYQQGQRVVLTGAAPGWVACEGLLILLRDTIAALPDHHAAQAVSSIVRCEVLCVLCKHGCAAVRAAVVRTVAALVARAQPELVKRLKATHFYLHLANQISLYPASWDLATACSELITRCDVPLQEQLDDDIWMEVCPESLDRSAPLLAILPSCTSDVPLAHNVTLIVQRIIDKASLKQLTELSVAEVCVRCITALGEAGPHEGSELLQNDFHQLLNKLAYKAHTTNNGMQFIADIHGMLAYAEHSAGELAALALRAAHAALLNAQLDLLEERLHTSYSAHTKYANYFTTVLSSAVSLGSESGARGERAELAARHLAVVTRAVSLLVAPAAYRHSPIEGALLARLLHALLPAVCGETSRPKWWVSNSSDWSAPLLELFWWAVSPAAGARPLHAALLTALYHAPQSALGVIAPNEHRGMRKLAVYLLTLLKNIHASSEEGDGTPCVELAITDWARGWAVGTQAGLPERLSSDCLAEEAARLLAADEERWAKTAHKQRPAIAKVVFAKDTLANKLTESAMGITRQVVDIQNGERKVFMEHLRRAHSEAVAATQRWQRLIDTYTHEEAVWHDPLSYPQSWQLDATEGPGRVRVRLRRAHLDIQPRFLKPEYRYKAETIRRSSPLKSVVGVASGLRGGLVARLQLHETVSHMARVTYVTVASDTAGELLLSDRCIHFVPEDCEDQPEKRSSAQSWPLEAVVQVATRRWCLQERAAEVFLSSGHAHLVAFADVNERNDFLKALDKCDLPNRKEPDSLSEAMSQWRNGSITNWEYLMRLNGLAGRSYNDLMQYPILPFVIADYSSRILDLNDPASFRDLSRPMAVQNKSREQHYINTYNDLATARREGCSPLVSRTPHHYASLYSNSGGVLHYLVRLPPFTEMFLNYQDNNFDMPDRTFHSLATTWRLITQDSPTDVKELIPELFYLPELFHNNEGLNLGIRQCGAAIDSVELPPWAADARLFTLAHRQALESPTVSDALPNWIDLVFGYKQTGQAAIDAINVFPACTYYGFDPMSLPDELERCAAAAMVRTYGQAPRQLLRQPHPQRAADLGLHLTQPAAYDGVSGVRWGNYACSPGGPPVSVTRRVVAAGARLVCLPPARTAAVATLNTTLIALNGGVSNGSESVGLLSWGHADHIVRLKRRRDQPPDLLLHLPPLHQITVVSSCCISGLPCPTILGFTSGHVLALRLRHDALGASALPPRAHVVPLLAHRAPITAVFVCTKAGVIATASVDGNIVVWDLHTLSYIRTLPNRDMLSVTHVTISETLCDVASVHVPARSGNGADGDSDSYEKDHTSKYQSLLRVHTVNGRYVGSVKVPELVTCVCYSNAPEGVSVNIIACGTDSGGVRLYSAWELRPAKRVAHSGVPLVSLCYSSDSSVLFGCYADGACVAWDADSGRGGGAARIVPAHSLL